MTIVLTQTSVGAEHAAAATWASILILLCRICLIFCPTVGITNRNILRHNQGLDWSSLRIICSNKHLFNYHRNAIGNFTSVAEVIALLFTSIFMYSCISCLPKKRTNTFDRWLTLENQKFDFRKATLKISEEFVFLVN